MAKTTHEQWMQHACALGRLAQGKTGDNPAVGCVIVKEGEVVGEGYTQTPGQAHAEVMAIAEAENLGESLSGATLYSTVEPCSFFGRTPPCAETIIAHDIQRVVIGVRDPHPNVNGRGIQALEEAGIEVIEGVGESEVRQDLKEWLACYVNT